MKKLVFLFAVTFGLMSCSLDDDGPNRILEFAEITEVDMPEYFETGETYDIGVTYLLPSACHTFNGFDARQSQNQEDPEIFVGVVTSYDANQTQCNEDDDDLSEEKTLRDVTINGEVGTVYTFYFLIGEDENGEEEYITIEVPVIDPDDEGEDGENEEEEENTDE